MAFYDKWKQYQYYVIIGIVSLVALFFLPMLGSSAGLAFVLPTTWAGWLVYIVSKLLVATVNILIFHCFNLQAKINVAENPNYLAALDILALYQLEDEAVPRSPAQYNRTVYGKKGVAIFTTSIISAVGLTQAILTFDIVAMLTYFFTILFGVIFGILQMNNAEIYWTNEFYTYAKRIEKAKILEREREEAVAMAAEELPESPNDSACDIGGSDLLVSPDTCGANGPPN